MDMKRVLVLLLVFLINSRADAANCNGKVSGFDIAACTFLQNLDGVGGVEVKFETLKSKFNHNCPLALKIDNQDYDITMLYTFRFMINGEEKSGRFIVQMMNWVSDRGVQNGRRITDLNLADISIEEADKAGLLVPVPPAYREVTFNHVNYSAPMDWGKFFKAISSAIKD